MKGMGGDSGDAGSGATGLGAERTEDRHGVTERT